MSLMITLEDVMKVLNNVSIIEDEDAEEWLRGELEQKCYLTMKPESVSWFHVLRNDIEDVTNPEKIAEAIGSGKLHKWLEIYRDNMIAELTLAARKGGAGDE